MAAERFPFPFPLTQEEITRNRTAILSHICADYEDFRATPIRALHSDMLAAVLRAYDRQFLSGFLSRKLGILRVAYSSRLVSSAGKFDVHCEGSGFCACGAIHILPFKPDEHPDSLGNVSFEFNYFNVFRCSRLREI